MNVASLKYVYFVGVGGIGMSALARYFMLMGKKVYGYDRTETQLTCDLVGEGIQIHYNDCWCNIPKEICEAAGTDEVLVIYTPAIPESNSELKYFVSNNFVVMKRAQVLGLISRNSNCIGIAGTHGKTSVSTMTAHLLTSSAVGCSAFLGGISKNYNTNFLYSDTSNYVVVEADEFDRSFHQLSPQSAVVTSMDADHLDIYGTHRAILDSFYEYINKINEGGNLVFKLGLPIEPVVASLQAKQVKIYSYSLTDTDADFYASNLKIENQAFHFSIVTPLGTIDNVTFSVPGTINIENAVAATAMAVLNGVAFADIRTAWAEFKGVRRRFDYHVKNSSVVYIDDYAHHPEELRASISSIRDMFPGKKLTGIFQPHLFSRTNDFAYEFGESLSLLDEVYLMEIYPARELPMPGVTSELIFKYITAPVKIRCSKDNLMELLQKGSFDVLMTIGAGDIDTFIEPITTMLKR